MNKHFIIQLKAAFLLVVFSLNTMSGFACAMGMDMGFDSRQPSGKASKPEEKTCHSNPGQSHDESKSNNDYGAEDNDRNCCGDKMIRFDKLDKSVVKSLTIVSPTFLNVFVSTFYHVHGLFRLHVTPNVKYVVRSHHLPIPDIRVIIRSFQV